MKENADTQSGFEIIAVFVLVLIGVLFRAWILMNLWQWFIVPFKMPSLTLPWALGIGVLVTYFKPIPDKHVTLEDVAKLLFSSAIALALGYLYHNWM
jgi:hypothetical protein